MADILNPWIELESDIVLPPSFSPHFPFPLQEVKVEIEDSETSASSYRENGDFSHGQATYISLDSYEQISSPQSSYSHESLSPTTTNSDNSVTSPLCVKSASVIPETASPHLRFQYSSSMVRRPEQSPTPSEFLNRVSPTDSSSVRQLYQSMAQDYKHNHSVQTTFPGTVELNGFQHDILPFDVSHPFYTHWTTTTTSSLEESPDSGNTPEQLRNFHSEQLLEIRASKECVNCGSSSAILWWQDGTGHFLCNLCSQALKTNSDNAVMFKDVRKPQRRTTTTKRSAMVCANCKADKTSLWRRNNLGETVCNACGLYFKLHKCNRPITMKKDSIQKRKRKPKSLEEKPKGRNNKSSRDPKIENGASRLGVSPDVVLKQELLDTTSSTSSSQLALSHQSEYGNSIRLLPPVYSLDGFRSSLSPAQSYISSSYTTRISPPLSSSLLNAGNLPSVDIFQGRPDYSTAVPHSSILSPMSC